jgi:transposase
MFITEGTAADCCQAGGLIEGLDADYLLADKAYDTDAILQHCEQQGIEPVIPAKRNRKVQREHDAHLYRHRHLVENAFLWLKRWRGIATRYAKNTASFLAAVQIRCLAIWANIL